MAFRVVKPIRGLVRRFSGAGWLALVSLVLAPPGGAARAGSDPAPFWSVARLTGESLRCLRGAPADRVAVLACAERCAAIPWQLDERDAAGRPALNEGPRPNPDDPPDVIDDNDEVTWMVEDAGRPMRAAERPAGARCAVEIRLQVNGSDFQAWAYAVVLPAPAPRSARTYVRYDAARDLITGSRVALGFGGPTPQLLALLGPAGRPGANLLDRLKVRVSARFLGLIPVHRDESDLRTELVAWRAGPIGIVRRQRQWVRLGWGIRSPTFGSDTYFFRDFAVLPVRLRLNFPPTYFFAGIEARAVLDFRDLRGWRLVADGGRGPARIGSIRANDLEALNELPGDWFALLGPEVTLVQVLTTSPSLATVDRRLFYREVLTAEEPEALVGEMPGVGYRLSHWEDVGSGRHWFSSTSYALPAGYDVRRFLRERDQLVRIETTELPNATSPSRRP